MSVVDARSESVVADFTEAPEVLEILADLKEDFPEGTPEVSDLIDGEGNQYVDLVLEGGGILGISLVGFTYVLEKIGMRIRKVGGTSAGAINALLIAALGRPGEAKSARLLPLLAGLDPRRFVDADPSVRDFIEAATIHPNVAHIVWHTLTEGRQIRQHLQEKLGFNPGNAFLGWISGILRDEGVATAGALRERLARVPEGLHHREGLPIDDDGQGGLALVVADVTTQTKVDFPRMAGLYWADPDGVDPALFVRASMSVPFFFEPLRIRDLPRGEAAWTRWKDLADYREAIPDECLLVDGGVLSNFPYDLFHCENRVPYCPTVGARLGGARRQEVDHPTTYAVGLSRAARHCLDYDFMRRHPAEGRLLCRIDTGGHNWLDFDADGAVRVDLFVRGAKAAAELFHKFNWGDYKRARAKLLAAGAGA